MKAAFEHARNIFCINHLINNVIERSISESSEVNAVVTTCSKLVKYFKKSGSNSALNTTLKSYTPTRWNTGFYLLSSIQINWVDITQILQEKLESSRFSHLNIAFINEVIEVLKPFEVASRFLEGEKYPTIHHVIPQIRKLKKVISANNQNGSEIIKQFKEQLLLNMDSVIDDNINDFHKIALFLFAPANKLQNISRSEKHNIHEKCKDILKIYESTWATANATINYANAPQYDDEINNEIARYESQTVSYHKEFDALEWWEARKREYPMLYKLSRLIFAIPASSAASERLFSKARHLLSEKRSVLGKNPTSVSQVMFLHSNLDLNTMNTINFIDELMY